MFSLYMMLMEDMWRVMKDIKFAGLVKELFAGNLKVEVVEKRGRKALVNVIKFGVIVGI